MPEDKIQKLLAVYPGCVSEGGGPLMLLAV